MSLTERQAELIETHRTVQDAELPYILVGGWAVSAFQTRFTTDVDMVLPESSLEEYDTVLTESGYAKVFDNDISNVYQGRIVRYEKSVGENVVEFDALVGALRCRQTDAEWSYRYLEQHSTTASLAIAEDLEVRIPEAELLFALKLHSGRLADTRDLVVVGSEASFERIEKHLHRGDKEALEAQIANVRDRLTEDGFEDSFKGVFQQETLPETDISSVVNFLSQQISK